ncbi:MAG: peptidoglycan DD-metalloendopeptidase family protein [Propionivibrio sp.]|uniref:peptidoglycan DD-metalloendopeptidase family protein n=1 Tax=Propionivibrio sp. TaxID=2212460 RepID=UPI001A61E422|nr:peptidoglycan DD-metalloendopeptidase family protein [Propionivibrio sp.]MBL8413196.1 peptidoglycan DD-metalloendopeptidase family protein [Propionivibrio sp.]
MKNNCAFTRLVPGIVLAILLVLSGCASKSPAPVGGQPSAAARDSYTVKPGDTLYSIAREHGMDFRELIALNGIDNPNRITVGKVLKVRPPAASTSSSAATSSVATTAPIVSDVVQTRPITAEPLPEKRPPGTNTEMLKREPKAGKEPYSDQALALAQSQGQAKPSEPMAPVVRAESGPEAKPEAKPEARPTEAAVSGDEIGWIWPANGKTVATFNEGGSKGVDIAGKMGDPVIAAGDGKVVYSGTGLRGYGKLVIIKHNSTFLSAYAHNQSILVKEGQSVSKGQKIAEMGNTDADQVKLHFEVRRQGKPVDPLKFLPPR